MDACLNIFLNKNRHDASEFKTLYIQLTVVHDMRDIDACGARRPYSCLHDNFSYFNQTYR